MMLVVVTTISFFVHIYSVSYMEHDPHLQRFLSYLSLFTFFMLILVTASNFLQMFVGWEGVGLASYLLISFWFTRLSANKSAIKAMIVNRVGDIGIVLAMLVIYDVFRCLDYSVVFSLVPYFSTYNYNFLNFSINLLDLISILIFIGVAGKSAQIGLHV
jgi:NADH:ubiquinone oxidoreductase subunit 5 (subunit L)/multisubunit Na+/H+ antiporter MnhA subunit